MNDAIKNADAAALPKIALKAGEQRRVQFGHPWVYSNEIAMDAAAKDPTADNFHEWRKRVKDHWYHSRLLWPVWQKPMKAFTSDASSPVIRRVRTNSRYTSEPVARIWVL